MVDNQNKPERKVKGIWIPIEIWEHKELTLQQKVFLAEIDSLDGNEGCWATNSWFADQFGISQDRASKVISSLVKIGLITLELIHKNNSKEVTKRVLRIIKPLPVETPIPPGISAYTPPGRNAEEIIYKKDNIKDKKTLCEVPSELSPTHIEKTSSLDDSKQSKQNNPNKTLQRKAEKVLTKLNELGSKPRGFRPTQTHLKNIIARLKEGFSVKDCIQVLETKIKDPWFIENPQHYNPETLFRPKNFEKYLNEDPSQYNKPNKNAPSNGSGVTGYFIPGTNIRNPDSKPSWHTNPA